jgi:hypothetical protein
MSINFKCPACGEALSVPPSMAGRKGRCPKCNASVPVPGEKVAVDVVPSPIVSAAAVPSAAALYEPTIQRVSIIDIKMPYKSMVWFIFKWTFAAGPTAIVLWLIYMVTNLAIEVARH